MRVFGLFSPLMVRIIDYFPICIGQKFVSAFVDVAHLSWQALCH